MEISGLTLTEGSTIKNASIDVGSSFPAAANTGELFYHTTYGFCVHNGTTWNHVEAKLSLEGGTLTGDLILSTGHKITVNQVPSTSTDVVNKFYTDTFTMKRAVRAATTSNIVPSGTFSLDGVSLTVGDRVLVKDQTTSSQNGIYEVTSGSWTRAYDAHQDTLLSGTSCFVCEGTINALTGWVLGSPNPITVDTTSLTFTCFTGGSGGGGPLTGTAITTALGYTPADIDSPAFIGTPTAATATSGTATTQLATTAFVQTAVSAIVSGVSEFNTRTGAVTLNSTDVTSALTYTPVPTSGTGASGTWNIDISGNAATATTSTDSSTLGGTAASAFAHLASPAFTGVPTAPTATVDTATTQLATTAFVIGQAATTAPVMDGSAAVGGSILYAREDHVHPIDTSRAPAVGSSSIATVGTVTAGTWSADTISIDKGGTGLTSIGASNKVLGVNAAGTSLEYKSLAVNTGLTVTHTAGTATFGLDTLTDSGSGALKKIAVDTHGRVTGTQAVGASDITDALTYTPVNKAGDAMSANLAMSGNDITGLPATPYDATSATSKGYVDAAITGLTWKNAVRVVSTSNGTLATAFANGQTVDGVSLVTGDRILLAGQTTSSERGIYTVNASGAPTRALDADAYTELNSASVFVSEGLTYHNTGWLQSVALSSFSGQTWTQFSGGAVYVGGIGVSITGNSIAVNLGAGISQLPSTEVGVDLYTGGGLMLTTDGTNTSTDSTSQLSLTKTGVTASTYTSVAVDDWGRVTSGSNPSVAASNLSNGTTGTGNIVLATSPTLVTPTLGIASATSINGTSIPTSKTLLVTTDIGNSVQAYDADLTTWSGITPATGIGTFLATPSSANLATALTDETGSGSLVFANSPTLSGTPILPTGTIAVTQAANDNSTKLATTAYVDAAVSNMLAFAAAHA